MGNIMGNSESQQHVGKVSMRQYEDMRNIAPSTGETPRRPGIPTEMERLEATISKLGGMVSELRMRMDSVLTPEPPQQTADKLTSAPEPRRPRCNFADGLEQFRYQINNIAGSVENLLSRLDA